MTALSKVIQILADEFGVTYHKAWKIQDRLAAEGLCIAKIDWCEQAAAVMDEWQAICDERGNLTADAARRAKLARAARAGSRRLPPHIRLRRDSDGAPAAVGEIGPDLRLGTDGGAP